ncbi:hypothetical protein JCM19237_945 [Photobacterium aphoticum]|uniref:Uncharacterized protein n=1 Tax=Photobacterium aphoticum TaxID=754436 RepID=A0A090RJL7_9GAMM|nr:hypothetical protein JCM19237_945 [Photobacterium aphoticum]
MVGMVDSKHASASATGGKSYDSRLSPDHLQMQSRSHIYRCAVALFSWVKRRKHRQKRHEKSPFNRAPKSGT